MTSNKTLPSQITDSGRSNMQGRTNIIILASFAIVLSVTFALTSTAQGVTDAPTGFDGITNGFESQEQFDIDRAVFEQRKTTLDGLGPVYNAQACAECHQNPVTGGMSQITNLRAGHFSGVVFFDHPGGSLINDRAIDPLIQEKVLAGNEVRTFRMPLSLLGDGFVECIANSTLVAISDSQPAGMKGQVIQVPVLETSSTRAGRFGWKDQHASLLSFAAEEYINQIGITNTFFAIENTSNGRSVAAFDDVTDPEDPSDEFEAFVRFIRSTKAPARDISLASTSDSQNGSYLFDALGCAICHVRSLVTAPPGTLINGGAFRVPTALGNKRIRPFSDFLIHDVGTGDGIVQAGGQSTRNKIRTPPLWGLRTRDRLMHDGRTVTLNEAILRHAGEATSVTLNYTSLSASQKSQLVVFLNSL